MRTSAASRSRTVRALSLGRGLLLRTRGASRVFEQRLNRSPGDGQVRQVLLQARHLTPSAIECFSGRAFFCVQTLEE
ncbi:hypothetical protein CP969_17055 [Streptomyces viridosporus T7A]|uniref:Uncharacterized protein n=1 Tax=Streptomyces viridosporus T7A TaxID=665577 RepID=A0ABX6AG16_STRVD|nr:hypothetical protein CP969_17055 [Streptomyces viridosporus T7A]